jgi:hypothetical protein
MIEAPLEEIRQKALGFNANKQKWHFHIMSPTCAFNHDRRHAFILESLDANEAYVYYSDQPEKGLGQELAPLLHGDKVLNPETTSEDYVPTTNIRKIVERANQLNEKNVPWHHHMLFPGCIFNQHSPKYALIFEDSETGNTLASLTDIEPTNDLKQIETLFYKKA